VGTGDSVPDWLGGPQDSLAPALEVRASKEGRVLVIGIAKDYLAIAVGAATVGSAQAIEFGRSAISTVVSVARGGHRQTGPDGISDTLRDAGADIRTTTERSKELIAAMIQSELERAVARIGLVPESELTAVRQQVERLERQLAESTSRNKE
jgi:hypothetical protein